MPWNAQTFAKHNKSFSPAQNAKAASIANHVLASTGDEGVAVATANKLAKRNALAKELMKKK